MDRRSFLITSTATAALAAVRSSAADANDTVTIGVMGVRGRGRGLAVGFAEMPDVKVAYLCDVDERVIEDCSQRVEKNQGEKPKAVSDFRRILEDPGVDAIVVATPDHWHALATILACQAGKDVYVEKPASHNHVEGRRMVEAARKYQRVVQHGTQSRSGEHYQAAVELLRSGQLGQVLMAKAINNQKRANIGRAQDEPTPKGVDYDMWLGPAALRPFNPNRFHYNWHWHWDYGTGDMGNDGVHQIDVARWGLGVELPDAVAASGAKLYFDDDQQTPDTQTVVFEYPRCQLLYEMRLWAPYHEHGMFNGNVFYGEKGCLVLGHHGWKVTWADNQPGPSMNSSDRDLAHRRNFVDCVKSRSPQKLNAEIEEGVRSASLCHFGNISYRVGRRLRLDDAKAAFIGDEEATALTTREYRSPWIVPDKV